MIKDKNYYDFLEYAFQKNKEGVSWKELSVEFEKKFNTTISRSCLRHRALRFNEKNKKVDDNIYSCGNSETDVYIQYNADGSVESKGKIECNSDVLKDPVKLLEKLGYNTDKWELITYRVSEWEGGKVDDDNKFIKQHAIKYKVKPKNELTITDFLNSAKKAFSEKIMPLLEKDFKLDNNELDDEKLMEIAPIELHLGKFSHYVETGEIYNLEIAKKRFQYIFQKIREKQLVEKCSKCVLIIGSDFFNSESDYNTSVNKTPQQNDSCYINLFIEAIKMYTSAIFSLKELFNSIDVMLCSGNHARSMETFLYIALQQRFSLCDSYIHFIENYKHTQVYEFGKCAIFYNHGDYNLKQTIKSIPAEFDKEWGSHPFRELHLGHLHKEVVVDEEGGMITRRIGSPCSTDNWHYDNRFVGSLKKHQIFVWNANSGLENIYYINIKK